MRGAILWAVPILALTAFSLTWFYSISTYQLFDEQLDSTINALIASAETDTSGPLSVTVNREPIDPRFQQALSGRYWLIGTIEADGNINPMQASRSMAGETLTLPIGDTRDVLASPGKSVRTKADGPDENDPLRVIARSVIFETMSDTPVIMVAAADNRAAEGAVRRFAALALGLMLLLTGGLIVAVFTQVRLGLKPLFELRARVADVREGRVGQLDGDYPPEIQPLATELNSLIDHNKNVVAQAKTHVGNLAHALKTPLAVLLNEAGSSKSNLADVVKRQSETMQKQVDHHLHRARAAARGQAIGVSTGVIETVDPLVRTLERIHRTKNIDFDISIPPDLKFRGEKRDLEEMIGNLMDNACKWTRSQVTVKAAMIIDDATQFEICVSDDGPGLHPSKYEEALQRGTRLDEATPGTGFGLAIVDDLARAYKGDLVLGRSVEDGLAATIRLPGRL